MNQVGTRRGGGLGRPVLWAVTVAMVAGLLQACGTPGPAHDSTVADVVTPSDEPEARRRAPIRLELAVGYFEQGKADIALDEVKQVIAIDPSFADAYNLRGLVFMRLGDNRAAEDSFRRTLALNPRDANAAHNLGWLQCQQARYDESFRSFQQAMSHPLYPDRAKTLMALGVCQARAQRTAEAEQSLARSYELDPANPVTGYNLASLLMRRGESQRAQFYIRRLNNSEAANAESLWLGIKVERQMNDRQAMVQLGEQLKKRFPQSKERGAYDRGAFDE